MNEFSTTTANFYRHSGKVPLLGLMLIGAMGLIVTPILGLIYGYLIFYIPFIYLNMLLVVGYVFAISFVLNKAIMWGKIRNTLIVGLAAFGIGIFAEYIGWVAWIAAFAKDPTYLLEFFLPWEVATIIIEIGKQGVWSFSDITPTGGFLYFIWLLEALVVVGGITANTLKTFSEVPFCEDSEVWVENKKSLAAFAPVIDLKRFKASILQGNFSAFNELKLLHSGNAYILFELYECETCKNFFMLNIVDVKISQDRRGRQVQTTKTIVKNLMITQSTLGMLKRMIQEQYPEMLQQQPAV